MEIISVVFFSYFSGSIPFGLILTKYFGNLDVRKIGSGNIGATNVLRAGNKYLAAATLILDTLKGYVPVVITQQFFPEYQQLSALMAFLGHVFPVWLKFKGGKGVATYLGVLFALSYGLSFLFIFTWVVVTLIFKYSSLSSMFSSLTVLVVTLFRENAVKAIDPNFVFPANIKLILFIFFILIIFTHKKNISNLINATEQKIKL
ncbi:MAG: acyl-phosphate glycerol 3-phosphate acyltransferase [Candidatus Pelagibacter sp.]|jgi:glycerol-3-phosphate acyltransferase PlsY|nr:acyl-phosphate glycerol 3-phosphate acyltransferase [Candidatus Pelagibacter sp.]|tara:strand:- start:3 stop:614 length:612 start_codon:yes stop_codon:yes gene_type:complete